MKTLFLVLALTCSMASHVFAVEYHKIEVDGVMWDWSPQYSFKIFTNEFLQSGIPSGTTVYGSTFYSEIPKTKRFPDSMKGVTFVCPNADNVIIPPGNIVVVGDGICGSWKEWRAQNDGEDWLINASGNPTEPIQKETFLELEISTRAADIPNRKMSEPITIKVKREKREEMQSRIRDIENGNPSR